MSIGLVRAGSRHMGRDGLLCLLKKTSDEVIEEFVLQRVRTGAMRNVRLI